MGVALCRLKSRAGEEKAGAPQGRGLRMASGRGALKSQESSRNLPAEGGRALGQREEHG